MTDKRDLIERKEQAQLLLSNDLFAEALTQIRSDALLALSTIDVADTHGIHRQQAIVSVTGEIVDKLKAHITAAGSMDGGYTQNSEEE